MTGHEQSQTTPGAGNISQSEIEQLLSDIGGGDGPLGDVEGVDFETSRASSHPARHQFPKLTLFSSTLMRKLRVRHEELIRYVEAQLASYLRLECALQMSKLETMPFQSFIGGLSDPTHLVLFNLAPLPGTCLLDVPPSFGLSLVDRQLGGAGRDTAGCRNLSAIEVRLISRVVDLMLSEWCSYWSSMIDLRARIIGHENNGRFVHACGPKATVLVLGITPSLGGEIREEIRFAFPSETLEPLLNKLAPQVETPVQEKLQPPAVVSWNAALDDMEVPVHVEFQSLELSTRRLAELQPGDVLEISPKLAAEVVVHLGERPKFRGELGTLTGRWAVRIKSVHPAKSEGWVPAPIQPMTRFTM